MPDSPVRVEASPDEEKEVEDDLPVALWELGRQFEEKNISALRRRVAGLTRDLERTKEKSAAVYEAIAVLEDTPLLTHDKCVILQRIEQRLGYLARRCSKDTVVPSSVLQELDTYAQGVRQITNAFLVVTGALALPTRIARETWACVSDTPPVAIKAH